MKMVKSKIQKGIKTVGENRPDLKQKSCKFVNISKNDIYKIPEKNNFKGLAAYVNSDLDWKENRLIHYLFYYGHTKKALCRHPIKDNIILFNCEHPFWKSGKDINELKDDEIGLLPEFYNNLIGDKI